MHLSTHEFQGRTIAVRRFLSNKFPKKEVERIFWLLKRAQALGAAIEDPIALIKEEEGNPQIVTVWKPKSTNLMKVLDGSKPYIDKQAACLGAIEDLARLHAAQILHGHAGFVNNIVFTLDSGRGSLVDYKLFRETNTEQHALNERDRMIGNLMAELKRVDRSGGAKGFEERAKETYEREFRSARGDMNWKRVQKFF